MSIIYCLDPKWKFPFSFVFTGRSQTLTIKRRSVHNKDSLLIPAQLQDQQTHKQENPSPVEDLKKAPERSIPSEEMLLDLNRESSQPFFILPSEWIDPTLSLLSGTSTDAHDEQGTFSRLEEVRLFPGRQAPGLSSYNTRVFEDVFCRRQALTPSPYSSLWSSYCSTHFPNSETTKERAWAKETELFRNVMKKDNVYHEKASGAAHLARESKGQLNNANPKTYKCNFCESSFSLHRLLNRHLKTHSFYKRHLCHFCNKGFNDTFDLKRHIRTHTGIKPFKCDRCDKSFTQRCSLEAHMTRVHSVVHKYGFRERRIKLFVCEDCGATFKENQAAFTRHVALSHPHKEKMTFHANDTSWTQTSNTEFSNVRF